MILSDFNAAVERKLCAGAIEFALDQYQEAHMGDSVDARLQAGRLLFDAAKQALAHLIAIQHDPTHYPRLELA